MCSPPLKLLCYGPHAVQLSRYEGVTVTPTWPTRQPAHIARKTPIFCMLVNDEVCEAPVLPHSLRSGCAGFGGRPKEGVGRVLGGSQVISEHGWATLARIIARCACPRRKRFGPVCACCAQLLWLTTRVYNLGLDILQQTASRDVQARLADKGLPGPKVGLGQDDYREGQPNAKRQQP